MIQEPPFKQSPFTDKEAKVWHRAWYEWLAAVFSRWGKFGDIKNGNYAAFGATGRLRFNGTSAPPEYADNAAALAGGLTAGDVYKTATGQLMIVY